MKAYTECELKTTHFVGAEQRADERSASGYFCFNLPLKDPSKFNVGRWVSQNVTQLNENHVHLKF